MGKRNKSTPPQAEQPATGVEAYPRSYALFIIVPMAILACGFIYAILPNRAEKPATNAAAGTNDALVIKRSAPGATNGVAEELSEREKAMKLSGQATEALFKKDFTNALQLFQAAIKLTPEDEDLHYNVGITYARMGKTNEAIASYQKALEIFPDYSEVHNNLGNLLSVIGRTDEAIQHIKLAIKSSPENANAHNNLGSILARQGKTVEAITEFAQAVKLQPDYLEAHYNLGTGYMQQSRYDEAIQEFQTIIKQAPNFKPAHMALTRAMQRKEGGSAAPGAVPPATHAPTKK